MTVTAVSTGWLAVAIVACYIPKVAGYLLPHTWLERPAVARVAGLITVALLSALVAVQTLAEGRGLNLDARVPAIIVAALLLWRGAPFIVVVLAAALVAAGLRLI